MTTVHAYAARDAKGALKPFEYELGDLARDEVEIRVESCGICHSDLSMLDNDWGMTSYPFVGGHEVCGIVEAAGDRVTHLKVGQRVGLGWFSRSCLTCRTCMSGDHNLCASNEGVIVGRHGGFADRVRCQATWATPIPDGVDAASAGPLFCGGITVFNPIVQLGVRPTDRAAVVGIGGLGHLAVQFLRAWGCEVVAFTSESKMSEALQLGAHRAVNSRDPESWDSLQGSLNVIISTVNVSMDWDRMMGLLAPRGRLHTVGAVPEPMAVTAFPMMLGQRSLSGSPLGSPATTAMMLDFCARHAIRPVTETFTFDRINDAFDRLRSGQARYRVVLTH